MTINSEKFSKIAESLRQYRRAELSDFQEDIESDSPVDAFYVDPLPSNAVLTTMLQSNTTFLIGRKGTGKSTVFAKAQFELRKKTDVVSVYIDIHSLHEVLNASDIVADDLKKDIKIEQSIYMAHKLRKSFLARVISELIKEINKVSEKQSLVSRWKLTGRKYVDVIKDLKELAQKVEDGKLTSEEIPILQTISLKSQDSEISTKSNKLSAGTEASVATTPTLKLSGNAEKFDESIADNVIYQEYANIVLRSFPFEKILANIKELLAGANLNRLFVFFDDFSELSLIEQKLFVDVVLSPLNNSSDETVKLKVAGYPGRIYYGKIDPGKIDTLSLDFYQIYKSQDIQTIELSAVEYLERLLKIRFDAFNEDIENYFDPSLSMTNYYRLLFEVTLNIPRLAGYILHYCYLDRIAKGQLITSSSIKLAAQKYYEQIMVQYFDRANRYALEPFERKLDRNNQKQLLHHIMNKAKAVQRGIAYDDLGGNYFKGVISPPTSHFTVSPQMEDMLSSLELNFLVTKYQEMRNKDGEDIFVYALFYGLCEDQKMYWGYPKGRRDDRSSDDRSSYFVQRCFNYNTNIKEFLQKSKTIRCDDCGASFDMNKQENFEFYGWKCPECQQGICKIITLGDDFKKEVKHLKQVTMIPPIELEILETLYEEDRAMRAGEIALLIDRTYQMVGRRAGKLAEISMVKKERIDGFTHLSITSEAINTYFQN